MTFNPNQIEFVQYKGEKSATVTIVGNTIIVTTRKR